jgi:hypothetical protein
MSQENLSAQVPALDEQAQRALRVAEQWIGGDIHGVAIGATPEGAPAVVVYMLDGASEAARSLPDTCEGLPVRVETGDAFTAGGWGKPSPVCPVTARCAPGGQVGLRRSGS